jgi:PRTRC genetic system protein B
MEAHARIGSDRRFKLKHAVLIYTDTSTAFASLHDVRLNSEGAPYLGPGRSVTTAFLRRLAQGLGAAVRPEVLPECVLARTPGLIVWWSRARRRLLFFGGQQKEARALNGHVYPHPPLVFKVRGRELFVRALAEDTRPKAETQLKTAPYWNTDSKGLVCTGTMKVPNDLTVESISLWENAYFASEFTHPAGAVRLTRHSGGFLGLWRSLRDEECAFPTKFLTDAKETLGEFIESGRER